MAESIRFDDKYIDPSGIGSADRQGLFNLIYPVGSIYMSVNSTSPATLFGGTWEQIKDRFLLASGSSYSAGATGGEATHTLTEDELPNITGQFQSRLASNGANIIDAYGDGAFAALGKAGDTWAYLLPSTGGYPNSGSLKNHVMKMSFGSNAAHNNMPPYLAVYIWKRTA